LDVRPELLTFVSIRFWTIFALLSIWLLILKTGDAETFIGMKVMLK
jgi:hypothetical protein